MGKRELPKGVGAVKICLPSLSKPVKIILTGFVLWGLIQSLLLKSLTGQDSLFFIIPISNLIFSISDSAVIISSFSLDFARC
jgi:hypothetical protein